MLPSTKRHVPTRTSTVASLALAFFVLMEPTGAFAGRANDNKELILIHMVTDANKNDANACIAFNLAWVAVEKGLRVEMLFDSFAGYNIKQGDFWARYKVPDHFRKIVTEAVGHELNWKGGNYIDLLKYLNGKGMVVSANKTFLAFSGDDQKLPGFVRQLDLTEMMDHLRNASTKISY